MRMLTTPPGMQTLNGTCLCIWLWHGCPSSYWSSYWNYLDESYGGELARTSSLGIKLPITQQASGVQLGLQPLAITSVTISISHVCRRHAAEVFQQPRVVCSDQEGQRLWMPLALFRSLCNKRQLSRKNKFDKLSGMFPALACCCILSPKLRIMQGFGAQTHLFFLRSPGPNNLSGQKRSVQWTSESYWPHFVNPPPEGL